MAAREHYSAENLGEFTVTSNSTWGSACTLSPTLANGVDYLVFWNVELTNQSNTTADAQARVTVGGGTVASFNVENRNTSEWGAYSGFFKVTGTGSALTIALETKAETNGNNIVARNRRLTVLRMGSGDVYTESTARQAVTAGGTTSFADVLSTTFSPDAGDYLVLGHSMTDNYATTVSAYGRFVWDGTAEGTAEVAAAGHGEIAAGQKNLVPLNKQRVYTEATGGVSRTVTWQGRSHQNGMEAGFQQNRLLVLRLADFAASHSAWLSELSWVEGTTASPVLAIEPTVTANPHLLLGSWYNNNVSSATGFVSAVLDDADDDNDAASSTNRVFNVADTRGQGSSFAGVRTYAAGPRPISLKVYGSGASDWTSTMAGTAFTLLDLGADESSTPVTSTPGAGSLTATGLAPTVSGGQSSSVTAGLGSLATSGQAPAVIAGSSLAVTPAAGTLALSGYAPSVGGGQSSSVTPATGSLTITGQVPTVIGAISSTVIPNAGALTVTGFAPTVVGAKSVATSPGVGSIILTGLTASVGGGQSSSVVVGIGSLAISGHAPAAQSAVMVAPAAASAALQGLAPTVVGARSVVVPVGASALSINGLAGIASTAVRASPTAASGSLSGHEPGIVAGVTVEPALTAPLTASGHAPTPSTGARLQTLSGSLLISGFAPAVLTGGAVAAQPGAGSIALNGAVPSVSAKARVDVAESVVITVIGHAPNVGAAVQITPSNDNLEVTGFSPDVSTGAVAAPLPANLILEPMTGDVIAGMTVTAGVVGMSFTGLQAEVRITSGRPTLTKDRTYVVPRDQSVHTVAKDVTTFKAA